MKKILVFLMLFSATNSVQASGFPVADALHTLQTIISELFRATDEALAQTERLRQTKQQIDQTIELIQQTKNLDTIVDVYGHAKRVFWRLSEINDDLEKIYEYGKEVTRDSIPEEDQEAHNEVFGVLDTENDRYVLPTDPYAPTNEYKSKAVQVTGTIGDELSEKRRRIEADIIDISKLLADSETDQEVQKYSAKLNGLTAMLLATMAEEQKAYQKTMVTYYSEENSKKEKQKAVEQQHKKSISTMTFDKQSLMPKFTETFNKRLKKLAEKDQ